MTLTKVLTLFLVLQIAIVFTQSEEAFLNVPLQKLNQDPHIMNYFTVNIEKKITNLQLTFVVTGKDKQSEPEVTIYLSEQDISITNIIDKQINPSFNCNQARNNVCVVPENRIFNKQNIRIIVAVKCYMKCSYTFEASYTEQREYTMNSRFTYQKTHTSSLEDISVLQGWFKVPKDQNLNKVKLIVYELFPNSKQFPIAILMNPGRQGVSGNRAKYESIQGALNSAMIILNQDDLKAGEFSFSILFPSSSLLQVSLEGNTGDIIKIPVNSFTQNALNVNEKIIYQIYNPEDQKIDASNMSLVVTIVSEQGYGLIKLAGKEIPQSDKDYVLSTEENIFEQKLVVTSEMRKKLNLGDDLFHIMIYPTHGFLLYLIEVSYEYERFQFIEDIEFNVQTHHILNALSLNQYRLVIFGNTEFSIGIKSIHKEGQSTMIVKKCDKVFDQCRFSEEKIQEIVKNKNYTSEETGIVSISKNKAIHDINFTSKQTECSTQNGFGFCIYYIAVFNHENDNSRYMLLVEHSSFVTFIKENELIFGGILPKHYKYYKNHVPSLQNNNDQPIEYVKIVLTSSSKKPYIGVKILSKTEQDNSTEENSSITNKSDFLIIRKSEFGDLNDKLLNIFVYSEEQAQYSLQISYHYPGKLQMKNIVLNSFVSDVIDSLEGSNTYKINLWTQNHQVADLKLIIKPIQGSFYFQFCQTVKSNQLGDCQTSKNNQLIIPKSTLQEAMFTANVQVFPQVINDQPQLQNHSILQYKFGVFFSDKVQELEKNEQNFIQLKNNEQQYFKLSISSGDVIRIFMFSDNETVEGKNAIAFLSYNFNNPHPNKEKYDQFVDPNTFVHIDAQKSQDICAKYSESQADCIIYITFLAYMKDTQVIFNANKLESIVKLYNGIIHKDMYPQSVDSYHRYYYEADRKQLSILQTSNPLSRLEIFLNFIDTKDGDFDANDETYYPKQSKYDYRLYESGNQSLNTIDFDGHLFDSPRSKCQKKDKCIILISIKIHNDSINKNLRDEYYIVRLFQNQIQLRNNERYLYMMRRGFNYFFKLSVTDEEQKYFVHVNPVSICDVQIEVLKLGEFYKKKYNQQGANLVVIEKQSPIDKIIGDYLITVSTEDSLCQFYVASYSSPYQYIKIEAGHYFYTDLNINQQLFLEYSDLSSSNFRVEASVEEGSIKMGLICLKSTTNWSPNYPIITYPENNIRDLRKHTLTWDKQKQGDCNRCKYVIAVSAIKETRLSIVIKNNEIYTTIPAQRMFKVEGLNQAKELFHFYPHQQKFSMQITLIFGHVTVYGIEGYTVQDDDQLNLFTLNGSYLSREAQFTPTPLSGEFNQTNQIHTPPFSFIVKMQNDSAFIISFQSNEKTMHLASGFPYFKQLDPLSSLQLQYKTLAQGYSKETEFSFYLQNDIYHASGKSRIDQLIAKNKKNNETIVMNDFYPNIYIENSQNKQQFTKTILSESSILYQRENEQGTFNIKIANDAKGLVQLDEKLNFYIVAHSGIQHLLQDRMIQKQSLQGSIDQFEFYTEGNKEVIIELIQCFGDSSIAVSDGNLNSYGSHNFQVISQHPNLYIAKVETADEVSNKAVGHVNYFFTIQNLLESKYRIRANVYPSNTIYPYQMYTSGNTFSAIYNDKTKTLDIKFDGVQCVLACESSVFQLTSIYYVFDSDYNSSNIAQGNAFCPKLFNRHDVKVLKYQENELQHILNNQSAKNSINHKNITTTIDIDDILDRKASQQRVKNFYISLIGKAYFYNNITKKEEIFYFPYKTNTLDIEWIESQKNKNQNIALIICLVFVSIIALSLIVFFLFRWYKKSHRNIRFEISDALNASMSTQPANSLQVNFNLNQSVEMNKYNQNYSQFKDEDDQEV